jgi:hypothetical protein
LSVRKEIKHELIRFNENSTHSTSDKVYQLLAHCRWFSPASSTTKTGHHDIAEILLKVALKHKKSKIKICALLEYTNPRHIGDRLV